MKTGITLLIFLPFLCFAQVEEMKASHIQRLDLSVANEQAWQEKQAEGMQVMDKMVAGVAFEDLSEKEKEALSQVDETVESYWDIIGGGCSWYCGGGPKEISASSYLNAQGTSNYLPENAHDLNYKNAWVEGVKGYGIGEYLIYTFPYASARITEIKIVNGYVKSQQAYENNSRVKRLKLFFNELPIAILHLEDLRAVQSFSFDPIGFGFNVPPNQADWTLRFEILEVYPGKQYDDVVISEIFFNGIDVHCFAKGTQILMADKTQQSIEALHIGDSISYLNPESRTLEVAQIAQLEKVVHCNLVVYHFESGLSITATQDHPFQVEGKGWASLAPNQSQQYEGYADIATIAIGDDFIGPEGKEKLVGIAYLAEAQETYTISKLSKGNNFIANGLVVGVESLPIKAN